MNFYFKDGVFTSFTYGGVTLSSLTSGTDTPQIGAYNLSQYNSIDLLTLIYSHSNSYPSFSSFTYEMQLIRNGTVVTTSGAKEAVKSFRTGIYTYRTPTGGNTLSFNDTYKDLSIYTIRIIIRINGDIVKTVDVPFISFPGNTSTNGYVFSLSSPSSPQTGKIGTMSVQRNSTSTSFAKVYAIGSRVFAYKQQNNAYEFQGVGYVNSGVTPVYTEYPSPYYAYNDYLSSFSCNYYIPYDSNTAHVDNSSSFGIYLFPDITPIKNYFTIAQESIWLSANRSAFLVYDSSISLSYVDQSDSNAAPTIGNVSIAESPAGISTTYGKYIGGGISTLTFSYSNVVYKYGGSFMEVTYKLYDSLSQLIGTWTSQTESSLSYTLQNTADTTYYLDVEITSTLNSKGTYRYSNILTYGYSPPYIVSFNASRCNQDGTPNDAGAYCKIAYQFRVIALGNHNSKEVTLTAPDGSHVYTNLDYDHGSPYQYISAADIEHSYLLTIAVEDDFVTVSASMNLSTAGVIMDFLYDGKGIGLGKVAETTEMVEVNPQWTFKADKITFKGEDLEYILTSLGYVFPT